MGASGTIIAATGTEARNDMCRGAARFRTEPAIADSGTENATSERIINADELVLIMAASLVRAIRKEASVIGEPL